MSFIKALLIGITLTSINIFLDYLSWGWIRYPIVFFVTLLLVFGYTKKRSVQLTDNEGVE
jgi:hypothetical protein